MAVTGEDVARAAGVSQATVSFVLNNTAGQTISEGTRTRVLTAARELGYYPNAAARSLKRGRGSTVLLPLPGMTLSHRWLDQFVEASSAPLAEAELNLVADFTAYPDPGEQVAAWLRLHPAAALDLTLKWSHPAREALGRAGVHIISCGPPGTRYGATPLEMIGIAARRRQLHEVISRGHRRVVFVGPPEHVDYSGRGSLSAVMRRDARRAGAHLTIEALSLSGPGARAFAARWVRDLAGAALCAYNDEYAVALCSALSAAGVDLSELCLIGVDDSRLSSFVTPGLASIGFDFSEMGARLSAMLAASSSTHPAPALAPTYYLAERESLRPPPAEEPPQPAATRR
jgi:DNA-binding LacI/PurR family transcriptional regulator